MSGYFWNRDTVANLLSGLLGDVNTALAATPAGRCQYAVVLPGADIPWDNCECGLLALAVNRVYRTRNFPQDAQDVYTKCDDFAVALDLKMVVLRCVPVTATLEPAAVYVPPTPAQTLAALQTQEEDRAVVFSTVTCSLSELEEVRLVGSYIVNDSVTLGPQGGCAGSQLNFKVALYPSCPCQPVP